MAALNPFRKHDSHRPLHARWGDVTISAPTEGSWSQYNNPHQPPHRSANYGPGYVPDCSPRSRSSEDSTSTDTSPSHRNSFVSNLNPRRLSMRLPRPRASTPDNRDYNDRQHLVERRPEFAYKPVRQNYPTEVAEKTTHHHNNRDNRASRFRYIPASPRYFDETPPLSRSASSCGSSRKYSVELDEMPRHRYGADYDEDDYLYDNRTLRPSHRANLDPKTRTRKDEIVLNPGRKRGSSKRMTMTMVPDSEDLYE